MTKKIILTSLLLLSFIFLVGALADYYIINTTKNIVFDEVSSVPVTKVGLVLGTSKTLSNGKPNGYFFNRINAAEELYKSGKVSYLIVSGDNGKNEYDEPSDMKDELVKRGIPAAVIYVDCAGFRTYDSVVRAKEVFGQNEIVIISQRFHNERAVFIAKQLGMKAFAFNAEDVNVLRGLKTKVREFFARVKVFIDLSLGIDPKFLGNKIIIG